MTEVSRDPVKPALLHIAGSASIESPEALAVEQWIAQAGMEAARCSDVYMGLARVLGNPKRDFSAVVVCVEDLSPDEFEFFSLLSRARRDLPVFVYGTRSPERVIRALQSGAKGPANQDALLALSWKLERRDELDGLALASPAAAPPQTKASAYFVSEDAPVRAVQPPSMPVMNEKSDSNTVTAQIEDIEDEPSEDSGTTATARVPWLRYSGGPERQRPSPAREESKETSLQDGTHDAAPTGNGTPPNDPEGGYEPLLTEQELAALLGDDFDHMALQEREMLTGDSEVPENGTR